MQTKSETSSKGKLFNKKSRTYGTSDLSDLSDLSESLRESDLSESPICERPKWEADL